MQGDRGTIDAYIVSLLSDSDIALIHITTDDGQSLHRFGNINEIDKDHQRQVSIKFATEEGIQNAGELTLGVSIEHIKQQAYYHLELSIVLFLSIVITVIVISRVAFQRTIGQPLRTIISAMESFEEDRIPRPIHMTSGDEINQVATTFNTLQRRLADYQGKLQQLLHSKTEALDDELNKHMQTTEQLFEARYRAQITLNSLSESVITTDGLGIINFINPAAEHLISLDPDEANGKPISGILNPKDDLNYFSKDTIDKILSDQEPGLHIPEAHITTLSGASIIINGAITQLLNSRDGIIGLSLVIRDITASKLLEDKLSHEASHDPLTGLLNRRAFESRVQEYIQDTQINGTQHMICYLDLDYFKVVNDTCGHQAGDEILRSLTRELKTRLRNNDILARLGGDEFALLLNNCSFVDAESLCNKIINHVSAYNFQWQEHQFKIGASIGIAAITADTDSVADLLRKADLACYTAKERGRNRVHVHS